MRENLVAFGLNGFTVASTNTNLRKRTADSNWLSFLGSFLNFYRCQLIQPNIERLWGFSSTVTSTIHKIIRVLQYEIIAVTSFLIVFFFFLPITFHSYYLFQCCCCYYEVIHVEVLNILTYRVFLSLSSRYG